MDHFSNILRTASKIIFLQSCLLLLTGNPGLCEKVNSREKDSTYSSKNKDQKIFKLGEQLQAFYPLGEDAEYTVTICADVPVNNKPGCVYKKGEPGHVFIILSKTDRVTGTVINRSFGFYPRVPVTTLFKQVRSKIVDNYNREYDASLETKLTKSAFAAVLDKCRELAKKKYNLNKYNCYDYVLEVFNSLPGIEKLPVTKVKFPFIFGRGGSPCGLYSDLKKLVLNGSAWTPAIRFGISKSPSNTIPNLIAHH